jgi:hypothetical protein
LQKLPDPKKGVKTPDDNEKQLRVARVQLVRELRLGGKDLKKAEELLNEALADWGRTDLNARMEQLHLLEAQKEYLKAYNRADELLRSLQPLAEKEPRLRESYFEVYYRMCHARWRYGTEQAAADQKQTILDDAVRLLKRRIEGNVAPELTDEARARYEALLKEIEKK